MRFVVITYLSFVVIHPTNPFFLPVVKPHTCSVSLIANFDIDSDKVSNPIPAPFYTDVQWNHECPQLTINISSRSAVWFSCRIKRRKKKMNEQQRRNVDIFHIFISVDTRGNKLNWVICAGDGVNVVNFARFFFCLSSHLKHNERTTSPADIVEN